MLQGLAICGNCGRALRTYYLGRNSSPNYHCDFTYDEDCCRVYLRDLPRDLACLTNAAISMIRGLPQFRYVPEANRHFAARPQEALDLLLKAPSP